VMKRHGDWMTTFSGIKFWVLDPRPEEVHIKDIAHSLSLTCRYNGMCKEFFSVAQHSVLVSRMCEAEDKLWGLLHDSAEAYISDVPTPVKRCIVGYDTIEANILKAVATRFDLVYPYSREVEKIDRKVLHDEAHSIMPIESRLWVREEEMFGIDVKPWTSDESERRFLEMFNELTKGNV
jgi:5'-deoxynucleotidase YfbR-like HD superfamily hydrolase